MPVEAEPCPNKSLVAECGMGRQTTGDGRCGSGRGATSSCATRVHVGRTRAKCPVSRAPVQVSELLRKATSSGRRQLRKRKRADFCMCHKCVYTRATLRIIVRQARTEHINPSDALSVITACHRSKSASCVRVGEQAHKRHMVLGRLPTHVARCHSSCTSRSSPPASSRAVAPGSQ